MSFMFIDDPGRLGYRFVFRMENGGLDSTFFCDPFSNFIDVEAMTPEDRESFMRDIFAERYPGYDIISMTRCSLGLHRELDRARNG